MYVVGCRSVADLDCLVRFDGETDRLMNGRDAFGDRCVVGNIDVTSARQRAASRSTGDSDFLRRVDAEGKAADESIEEALLRLDGGDSVRALRDDRDLIRCDQSPEPRR